MRKNILFDTSIGSQNMGDYIICDSAEKELSNILEGDFLVKCPTHTPILHCYQKISINPLYRYCKDATYKFVEGTNIMQLSMILRPWTNWNINIFNCKPYENCILVGAGIHPNREYMDLYTKLLYKKILSKQYIHSTRDERTKRLLNKLGFKAINTGCPTLWRLNKEFCKDIPSEKAEKVIFTLTDYRKNREKDQELINILVKSYKKVYFWIQGSEDFEYFNSFENIKNIELINPNLASYEKILKQRNIDYVGTRLHAGIYAMQHKVRSIIIAVDNRSLDMKETYNINIIERNSINNLSEMINSKITTNLKINEKAILEWKKQFGKEN